MTTVLQIIPSLGGGGAEQACVDVAAGLVAAGHRAIVVSSGGALVDKIIAAGGEHIEHPVASKNPVTMMANAAWLAQLVRAQKVNIIHARSRAPAWSAFWATRTVPCAFMTTFHAAYKFSNPVKKFYNSVMAKGDRVIAISHFIGAHIRETYGAGDRIRVIPRGIDLDKFAPEKVSEDRIARLRTAWNIKENQRLILCPARLSPIKGQGTLIDAIAALPAAFNDVSAVILGDDQGRVEYRKALEDKIAAHGLQNRVRLVAHCDDMPAAYRLAALAVAPSLVPEGFGRVPVEAMAMNIPAIASATGGFTETITPGVTGWLVPPDDATKLAASIAEVLNLPPDKRAAITDAARQEVHAHYDKRKMVADTLEVYAELMRG